MAKVQFGIPTNGTISFWFDDIWTPEGYIRIVMWRDLHETNDRGLIGGSVFKSAPVLLQGETVTRITNSFRVDVNPRVILRKPRYKKRVEKRFKRALIDGFDLEFYDTPSNEDISFENNILKPKMELDNTPYERLFSKYIKPETDTEVYCAWYFKEDGTDEYVLRTTGQLQNAIQGIDHQWTHANTQTPYWTFDVNKPLDRETVWALKFSHVAIIGLGKTPARPTQNASETGTWYMPFYNPDPTDAHASDTSELPFASQLADPSLPTGRIAQGVSQITYTDSTVAERVPMWRRHIPIHYALKLMLDYAYGAQYTFTSDDCPFTFIPAKFENKGGLAIQYGGWQSEVLYDSTNRKTVNPAHPLPDKWFLLPQCLFGLYDQIANGGQAIGRPPVPIPQKHWGNSFESAFELVNEWCFSLGLVPIVSHSAAGSTIHFKERGTAFDNKFSFIIPTQATPELFPEFESGVKVTTRTTFKNADEQDGDYDEWFAKFANTGTLNADISKYTNPLSNPFTRPTEAQKPAEMEISMTFAGAHMTGANDTTALGNGKQVMWYSVGTPDVIAGIMSSAQAGVSEQFPMFSPLILGGGGIFADANTTGVGSEAIGRYFAPILSALWDGGEYADRQAVYANAATTDDFTITGEGALFRTYRELLTAYYSAHFVRSDEKYTITVPTITQFTDQTTGSATKGNKSWQFIDILFQTELFGFTWYVQSIEQDFETMTTRFELYKLEPTLKTFSDDELDRDGTPVDYYNSTTPEITGVIGVQTGNTVKGNVFLMSIVPQEIPLSGITAKVMPAGTEYDFTPMGNGQWYINFDTTTSANGTYTFRVRATSVSGATTDANTTLTIAN